MAGPYIFHCFLGGGGETFKLSGLVALISCLCFATANEKKNSLKRRVKDESFSILHLDTAPDTFPFYFTFFGSISLVLGLHKLSHFLKRV